MSGFSNAIIGGAEVLIRSAMRSANWVAHTAGWKLSKDGTADLNSATLRGSLEVDGANNSFGKLTTTGGTGFGTAVLQLRPPDLPGIATNEISAGQIFALSNQPGGAGIVPSAYLSTEVDSASWSFGSTAVDQRAPVMVLQTASHDGTVHPLTEITTTGPTVPATHDIKLDGQVEVTSGRLKGGASCLLTVSPAVAMASGTAAILQTPTALDDALNMFNFGTSIVTLPYTGEYEIGYLGTFTAQAVAAGYRALQIGLNGATYRRYKLPTSASVNAEILAPNLVFRQMFFAGDQITFLAFQNSGASLNFSAEMWVELKRPTT